MAKSFRYTLLGFLLFTLTINCKAEEFHKEYWNENECIGGNWKDNYYYKLEIVQWYQRNYKWYYQLLYYSKYAYAFSNNEKPSAADTFYIRFRNRDDYIETKYTWKNELPDYILKRMVFIDKYSSIRFLAFKGNSIEGRENTYKIHFFKTLDVSLEEAKQLFPNAKELSR